MANKQATPLSTMLGNGEAIEIKGKTYTVTPIALKDIEAFTKDNLSIGPQLFNITDKENKSKTAKWLEKYCVDDKGNAVTLDSVMEDGWDVKDLREFIKKLCDMSG